MCTNIANSNRIKLGLQHCNFIVNARLLPELPFLVVQYGVILSVGD